jgi:hypothetical protein
VPAAHVTLLIEDSVIRDNPNAAVGVNLLERPTGSTTIARTTFDGNGRAIEAQVRKLALDQVVIKSHVDTSSYVVRADFSNRVDVTRSEIHSNATGGIASGTGAMSIKDSTIRDNGNVDSPGGGVSAVRGALRLERSTVSGNIASNGGGVIIGLRPSRILASTISGNSAVGHGGGVLMTSPASLLISRSTVSGNSAARGGGIVAGGKLRLSNSTVAANSATDPRREHPRRQRVADRAGLRLLPRGQARRSGREPERLHGHVAGNGRHRRRRPHARTATGQWRSDRDSRAAAPRRLRPSCRAAGSRASSRRSTTRT